jgi:hypothetical protein
MSEPRESNGPTHPAVRRLLASEPADAVSLPNPRSSDVASRPAATCTQPVARDEAGACVLVDWHERGPTAVQPYTSASHNRGPYIYTVTRALFTLLRSILHPVLIQAQDSFSPIHYLESFTYTTCDLPLPKTNTTIKSGLP